MTYCLGIKVNEGLVLASDSRTNAGVDYVSVFSKMYRFPLGPQRVFAIVTSGNLATSQAAIQQIRRDLEYPNAVTSLNTVECMFDAANYLGQVSQMVQNQHAAALSRSGINGDSYFIIGGQIGGQSPEIYLVYAQGNCISPSPDNPFLQIGETKYGKPILDRVICPTTSIEDAARAALVSIDSTIRSNITVGPPVELTVIRTDSFAFDHYLRLEEQDTFYRSVKEHWNEGLKQSFKTLPRFPWEPVTVVVEPPPPPPSVQPVPEGLATPQPQGLAEQTWGRQLG
jgi:putative proteasome-type protease